MMKLLGSLWSLHKPTLIEAYRNFRLQAIMCVCLGILRGIDFLEQFVTWCVRGTTTMWEMYRDHREAQGWLDDVLMIEMRVRRFIRPHLANFVRYQAGKLTVTFRRPNPLGYPEYREFGFQVTLPSFDLAALVVTGTFRFDRKANLQLF